MDYLIVGMLILGVFALFSSPPATPPAPPIIVVQPAEAPSSDGGLGCLPWVIGLVILAVVSGGIQFP
jgi:hypothetical protein